jgi:signal peptidase II
MAKHSTLLARPGPAMLLIAVMVALDQAIKLWVEETLPLQQIVELAPMLALFRTYNEGIAFSFLAGFSDTVLIVLTTVIIGTVIYLWRKTNPARTLSHAGFLMIIGGAIGNLVDRIAYGHVVDYILFYTDTWSFAVFNLADSFITVGAVAIIADELLAMRTAPKDQGD